MNGYVQDSLDAVESQHERWNSMRSSFDYIVPLTLRTNGRAHAKNLSKKSNTDRMNGIKEPLQNSVTVIPAKAGIHVNQQANGSPSSRG